MSSAGVALSPVREDPALSPIRFDGSRSPHCSPESIVIYLAVPGSVPTAMRVLESDSIASVKLRIQHNKGFVVKKQKLVFDGRELARNDCLIRDYGLTDGNVLHLVIRLSDLRQITVETTCGKKFVFQAERSQNIGYIKQRLARQVRHSGGLEDQELTFEGEELEDHQLITDICKKNNAAIHLLIRKSAKVRAKPVEKDLEVSIVAPGEQEKLMLESLPVIPRKQPDRDALVEPVIVNPAVKYSLDIRNMIQTTIAGLEKGCSPIMSAEGSGGAYFMRDVSGHNYVAVFKPIDEEPMAENNPRGLPLSADGEGLKRGTRAGEGALREVAAYILDHPISGRRTSSEVGFAGVPPTVMVQCLHDGFNHAAGFDQSRKNFKIGSLQMFVKNHGSCEDMGPRAFPVEEVHKISVLDIRLVNADRHAGNILVCKDDDHIMLVPIDHGYCLPENFEDCTFEWLYWPQARRPFNKETIDYIRSLDIEEDIALLKFHGWELSPECRRVFRISTMLLKKGVDRGLTAYDIGSIMCRETLKKESEIEDIIRKANDAVLPGTSESAFLEAVSEIMDRRLDELFL